MSTEATIGAVAPWYGSNRMLAPEVGKLLEGCKWVGVPFAGGMSEVLQMTARTILVNDLHRHVINLAQVIASNEGWEWLVDELSQAPFHPDVLASAQKNAAGWEWSEEGPSPQAALWYFMSQWMGRSGKAGTADEFKGKLPIRWTSSGGDSNVRYRSAVSSIEEWRKTLVRCNFSTLDAFEFLRSCKDQEGHAIYCDPPFPGPGDKYAHNCGETDQQHREWHTHLRDAMTRFQQTRVVMRYYDHPLIRELYLVSRWEWRLLTGRKSSNAEAAEVLLVRN